MIITIKQIKLYCFKFNQFGKNISKIEKKIEPFFFNYLRFFFFFHFSFFSQVRYKKNKKNYFGANKIQLKEELQHLRIVRPQA